MLDFFFRSEVRHNMAVSHTTLTQFESLYFIFFTAVLIIFVDISFSRI